MQRKRAALAAGGGLEGTEKTPRASATRLPAGAFLPVALVLALVSPGLGAEVMGDAGAESAAAAESSGPAVPVPAGTVACSSKAGERQHCPADTSGGVALMRATGMATCLLGKTWGYDDKGVWVMDGCGGEFVLGQVPGTAPEPASPELKFIGGPNAEPEEPERSSYGVFDASGTGFLVGRTGAGEMRIGGYALVRYINQMPASQEFTDHLGTVRPIDTRRDIQFHRAMVHFRGWLGSPKFRYQITIWTVQSTDQTTLYGFFGYQFNRYFNLYGGTNGIGGSRSLYGSHPFWLANDRVMADEFFRGAFTNGAWLNGEPAPGLWYQLAVGNNLSNLGITAKQLNRSLATGGSIWWMPTTHEFGPNGSYDDWEYHEKVATRFGVSTAFSAEDRQEQADGTPENTQVKIADSLNLFDANSLATGVTVQGADVRLLSFDAGMKYHGIFLQTELYDRRLDNFRADGPLPIGSISDRGFYVQAAFYPIKKKLELYGATSWVYGDKDAGFGDSHEYLVGGNIFWFDSRNIRTNVQVMSVDRSPANSTFGFYVGGQKGTTVSVATSLLF